LKRNGWLGKKPTDFRLLCSQPAGSDLGSFLMIYRNWVSVFLQKIGLLYQKSISKIGLADQKF